MKNDLIKLIDLVDEIEDLFHPILRNGNIPSHLAIYDVQQFQDWLHELQLELCDIYDYTKDSFIQETLNTFNKPMDGLKDKQFFSEIKGKLNAIRKNIDKYYPVNPNELTEKATKEQGIMIEKKPKIFVSHSSNDIEYVAQLVNLLDGMGLNQTQIFCSSLPGYGIPIDTNIFNYLRDQFLGYNLHVIFVHSNNYYMSPVSLNEMGAAWALKNTVTSILLPGFGFDKMTGVVNDRSIAIKLDIKQLELQDKLNQLYDKIVDEFGLTKKADIIWQQKRDSFIKDIHQIGKITAENEPKLSNEAMQLIKEAASDPSGEIMKISDITCELIIQGGSTHMNENASQRENARWIAALDELVKAGLIVQKDTKGEEFCVTDAGYKFIDR